MVANTPAASPRQQLADLRRSHAQVEYQIANLADAIEEAEATRRAERDAWRREQIEQLRAEASRANTLYAEALTHLTTLYASRTELVARVRAAKHTVEESEASLFLSGTVEGKNLDERKARLTLAVRADPACHAARADLAQGERDHDECVASISIAEKRLDGARAALRIVAASLEALAG